jgi:nucleoid-associated protein YgaU
MQKKAIRSNYNFSKSSRNLSKQPLHTASSLRKRSQKRIQDSTKRRQQAIRDAQARRKKTYQPKSWQRRIQNQPRTGGKLIRKKPITGTVTIGKPTLYYTVAKNDNLWTLSKKIYGNPHKWRHIYNANKRIIGNNPHRILPHQRLRIPPLR